MRFAAFQGFFQGFSRPKTRTATWVIFTVLGIILQQRDAKVFCSLDCDVDGSRTPNMAKETSNEDAVPTVFLSHAHSDKERFVRSFAERLYSDGVRAWVDEWEINPGDSLVQKLLEEGIKNAQAVIIVLSKNSIESKWVRVELDAAFVKRVESSTKIIPVVLDEVEVPETLRSTIHAKITDLENYDVAYQQVLRAIFDHHPRPALGSPPGWANATAKVFGLKPSDQTVFKTLYDNFIEVGGYGHLVNADALNITDLNTENVVSSLDYLVRNGLVTQPKSSRGLEFAHLMPTTHGFQTYGSAFVPGFNESVKRVLVHILDAQRGTQSEIVGATGCQDWIVDYALHDIHERGLAVVGFFIGSDNTVAVVKPGLRRYVEDFE